MPTGPGGLDSNGIWQFGEDDSEALASDLLNLGMGSVSDAFTNLAGVLQVVSVTKTDTFSASVASGAFSANVTGLSATITPASSSSTILVRVNVSGGSSTDSPTVNGRMLRGSTAIGVGAPVGNRSPVSGSNGTSSTSSVVMGTLSAETMDNPATTSATTYNFQLFNSSFTTKNVYMNRTEDDLNATRFMRAASTITLMEVAG